MSRAIISIAIVSILSACASQSTAEENAHSFLSVVGTPFFLALKIPVCAATVALAVPAAGLSAIAEPSPNTAQEPLRQTLDEGIADNCGPPFVLYP